MIARDAIFRYVRLATIILIHIYMLLIEISLGSSSDLSGPSI